MLENSLTAKEKIISDLNMELHNIETALSDEREKHMHEIKRLNSIIIEKVYLSPKISTTQKALNTS